MTDFPSVLRRLRRERHMTQPQLAEKLGISRSAIGMYENGEREPDLSMLCAMADLFDISLDTLVGRQHPVSEAGVKLALFGDADADSALYEDVKAYADFQKSRRKT